MTPSHLRILDPAWRAAVARRNDAVASADNLEQVEFLFRLVQQFRLYELQPSEALWRSFTASVPWAPELFKHLYPTAPVILASGACSYGSLHEGVTPSPQVKTDAKARSPVRDWSMRALNEGSEPLFPVRARFDEEAFLNFTMTDAEVSSMHARSTRVYLPSESGESFLSSALPMSKPSLWIHRVPKPPVATPVQQSLSLVYQPRFCVTAPTPSIPFAQQCSFQPFSPVETAHAFQVDAEKQPPCHPAPRTPSLCRSSSPLDIGLATPFPHTPVSSVCAAFFASPPRMEHAELPSYGDDAGLCLDPCCSASKQQPSPPAASQPNPAYGTMPPTSAHANLASYILNCHPHAGIHLAPARSASSDFCPPGQLLMIPGAFDIEMLADAKRQERQRILDEKRKPLEAKKQLIAQARAAIHLAPEGRISPALYAPEHILTIPGAFDVEALAANAKARHRAELEKRAEEKSGWSTAAVEREAIATRNRLLAKWHTNPLPPQVSTAIRMQDLSPVFAAVPEYSERWHRWDVIVENLERRVGG
ncbi:hypothetical protein C8R43DRAFT_1201872 [Mycena crocata]|nr:hypothetical protein C8R43DRAFT_1201872 [Mycena crocata]